MDNQINEKGFATVVDTFIDIGILNKQIMKNGEKDKYYT